MTSYQEEGDYWLHDCKCIDYGIRNKVCKFCSKAEEKGQKPSKHDCRKKKFWFSKGHGATDLQITV